MKCPTCNAWTEVLYTQPSDGSRRRRYQCANLHRFWTEERVVGPSSTATEEGVVLLTKPQKKQRMPRLLMPVKR